jgi:hypothetical protein
VASISTMTSPPSAPAAASPASLQARFRAAVRAARIAFSARGNGQPGNEPGHHWIVGHRPEQGRLGTQHRHVGQAVTAQRQHHAQARHDLPRRHEPPATPATGPAPPGSPEFTPVTRAVRPGYQHPARSGHDSPHVNRHQQAGTTDGFLYLKAPLLWCGPDLRQAQSSQADAFSIANDQAPPKPRERPRLATRCTR